MLLLLWPYFLALRTNWREHELQDSKDCDACDPFQLSLFCPRKRALEHLQLQRLLAARLCHGIENK